jgi:hypothetical protein
LPSVRKKVLGKEPFADEIFVECYTRQSFAECLIHSVKNAIPVVRRTKNAHVLSAMHIARQHTRDEQLLCEHDKCAAFIPNTSPYALDASLFLYVHCVLYTIHTDGLLRPFAWRGWGLGVNRRVLYTHISERI